MGEGTFYLIKDLERWGVCADINTLDYELRTMAETAYNEDTENFIYEGSYDDIEYKIYCGILENELDDEDVDTPCGYIILISRIDIIKNGAIEEHSVNLHLT